MSIRYIIYYIQYTIYNCEFEVYVSNDLDGGFLFYFFMGSLYEHSPQKYMLVMNTIPSLSSDVNDDYDRGVLQGS